MEREKKEKEIKKKIGDYQKVFQSEEGKAVLEDLKKYAFFNATTFNTEEPEKSIFFKEGMRNIVLYIEKIINKKI